MQNAEDGEILHSAFLILHFKEMGGPHVKTRRHSKVTDQLSDELRAEVDRLLVEGAAYEDIADYLRGKGYDISKSSIGRYGKEFLSAYQRLRVIEDQSRTLVSEAGGDGLILEETGAKLFAQKIIELLMQSDVDIRKIPKLVSGFASLQASSVHREKFKSELKKKVEKVFEKTEKKMEKMTKEEMLRTLREEVYGLT
jgi:DNA-binding transcriptional ArsR family regulator